MIAELVATMALEGGYQELARIVHPHPTISEAILDAARAVDGWAIHASEAAHALSGRARDLLLRPRLALRVPAAERISGLFADAGLEQPEWQPILLGGLFKRFGRDSWANGPGREEGIAEVERRAAGLRPAAARLARPLARQHAVRDARRDLRQADRPHRLLLPRRLPPGLRRRARPDRARQRADRRRRLRAAPARAAEGGSAPTAVKAALREATDAAGELGVIGVPALVVGDEVFWGDDRLRGGGAKPASYVERWRGVAIGTMPTCPTPPPVTSCSRGWR